MKRLRYLFAAILLFFALPFWRFTDVLAFASPFDFPLTLALTAWFGLFIGVPLKLILGRIQTYQLLLGILSFGILAWWASPLSKMATKDSNFNHCGGLTFTGTFYPLRSVLTDAYRDDLEARNQLCWVRKMISKVPEKFDSEIEIETYSKIIQERLLGPEIKYRVTLPLIAALYFRINPGPKFMYDSLHFWIGHYTDEISSREYSPWNWPHSRYIQFEYGLVEKNWESLIDSIVITN